MQNAQNAQCLEPRKEEENEKGVIDHVCGIHGGPAVGE